MRPKEEAVQLKHGIGAGIDGENNPEGGDPNDKMKPLPKPKMRTIKVIGKNGE